MPDTASIVAPVISVIVPIYNVEDYMALSLRSVLDQTLTDIEVICVDDGSTDGSGKLLDMIAALDPRIISIHKENGGLSSARNAGIERAKGTYICFLDSDDLMVENACTTILEAFESTGADVITYGGTPYPDFYGYPWLNEVLSPRDVTYEKFEMGLLTRENSKPFAWRTACRRDFLKAAGIEFDSTLAFGEDQVFHFSIYPRARKTALISDKLIKYRVSREGSLMFSRSADPSTRIREHIQIVDHILADWESGGLLSDREREAFDWSVEFLIHDIFTGYDASEQQSVSAALAAVWRQHFSLGFLEERACVRRYGEQVRLILTGAERPSPSKQKLMLFRYSAAEYGLGHAIKRALANLKRSFAHASEDGPLSERTPAEQAWEQQDAAERLAAREAFQKRFEALP